MGENSYHVKFSLNSRNNFNYRETSPDVIAGERKKKIKIKYNKIKTRTLFRPGQCRQKLNDET
jgi:hypothetical protein